MSILHHLFLIICLLLTPTTILAELPKETLKHELKKLNNWKQLTTRIEMRTLNKGKEKRLLLDMNRTKKENQDYTHIYIDERSDHSKGMKVLGKLESGELTQWVYLPKSNRLQKIRTKNTRRFFKTALIFEDFSLLEEDKLLDLYKITNTTKNTIRLSSIGPEAYYTQLLFYFDPSSNQIQKVEMFNNKNQVVKRMSNFEVSKDKHNREFPSRVTVEDIRKNRITHVHWQAIHLDPAEFDDSLFDPQSLKKKAPKQRKHR